MTRKTQPGTNWRVFWQSITLLSSSSKTPGKATGSVSDWTHVCSPARRKSKWTIGGCGGLRRCGCARTYEGTQFLCVKFCLGSAGEPTICSHCYDVLNEDTVDTTVLHKVSLDSLALHKSSYGRFLLVWSMPIRIGARLWYLHSRYTGNATILHSKYTLKIASIWYISRANELTRKHREMHGCVVRIVATNALV